MKDEKIDHAEITNEKEDEEKIVLPIALQKNMMEFFMKTSIPRKKRQAMNLLSKSENKDRDL